MLYGKEFWENVVNWDYLVDVGTISKEDLKNKNLLTSFSKIFLSPKITNSEKINAIFTKEIC